MILLSNIVTGIVLIIGIIMMGSLLVNFFKIFFKSINNTYVDVFLSFIPSKILGFAGLKESNVALIIMSLFIYVFLILLNGFLIVFVW